MGSEEGTRKLKDSVFSVWFQLAVGICSRLAGEILPRFNNFEEIYKCSDFSFLGEKREKYIKRLESKDTSEAFEVLKRCQALRVRVTGFYDELYPESLRKIEAPPAVLYSIGDFRRLDNIACVAVVGTRKMTDYGRNISEKFAYTFAKSGACVVSGLASGVDTSAHRGAIMADGYTIAVLGNPIGDVYPRENERAFATLYERGLVISEMYPGAPRTRGDFPNRNRIISGISDAVVIAEAGERSGALITARYAINQGKMLFAVPGAIGAENAGTNTLIKTGVSAATEPYDILAPLALEYPETLHPYEPSLTENLRSYGNIISEKTKRDPKPVMAELVTVSDEPEKPSEPESLSDKILSKLSGGNALTADELSAKLGCSVTEVMTELTLMEIYGDVVATIGGRFIKN